MIHFNGSGSLFDPGDNLHGIPRLGRRGRLLVAGTIECPGAGGVRGGVAARTTSSDLVSFDDLED